MIVLYALTLNESKTYIHLLFSYDNKLQKVSIEKVKEVVLDGLFEWLLIHTQEFREDDDLDRWAI